MNIIKRLLSALTNRKEKKCLQALSYIEWLYDKSIDVIDSQDEMIAELNNKIKQYRVRQNSLTTNLNYYKNKK